MRIARIFVALAAATLMVTGCADKKEPAEKALAEAEASLTEVRADAEKYAAENLKDVDATLARLKDLLVEKQQYKRVLLGTPTLAAEVSSLKEAIAVGKAEAEATMAAAQAEWNELSTSVPQLVEALQSRVDTLTTSRKLPKNLDKATFESAKSELGTIKANWTEASADFAAGHAADAIRKARGAKAKGEEVLQKLGMTNG